MRRAWVAVALAGALASPAAAQSVATARLEIRGVGDSTVTLRRVGAEWLRAGQRGIVVDPRRNDALVARFRLLSVEGDSAVALLTGLTSPVARQHVALVDAPRRRWFRQSLFWIGALAGAAVGVAAGAAL